MAYAHIAHGYASAQTSPSVTINSTGADIAICGISGFLSGDNFTVVDSLSNSWNSLTVYGSGQVAQLWWSELTTSGSIHTLTVGTNTESACYASIFFAAFSGSKSSSTLDSATGNYNASSVTSIQPGSIVPGYTGDLIIALVNSGWTSGNSINESFAVLNDADGGVSGQYFGGAMAYLIDTNVTVDPTWSGTPGGSTVAAIAAFRSADGSPITASFNPGWAYRSTSGIIGVS